MILLKKALRSILRNKKAYVSCIVLMALGVIIFTSMNTALFVVDKGKEAYYNDNRLGDAFATVTQIPRSSINKLEEIEGIKQVDGRLVQNVRVIMPDNNEDVITLRLISTIIGHNDQRLNAYVHTGNDLVNIDDIFLGYDFYKAYEYEPGDKIKLLVDNKVYDFNIAGSVYSPEYVYIVKEQGDLFSDTTKYNIAYIDEEIYMSITGMEGIYNDLSFQFDDGITYDDVKNELEYELEKYGLITLYEKDDLFSYLMLEEEIKSGKSMSTSMPMAFVSMAAIVLYLMLKRIIEQDRSQIGMLKAFGYSNTVVLNHYIIYGLVTGVFGAILGLLVGYMVTGAFIQVYLDYYKLPIENVITDYRYFYVGGIISVMGGIIGAYLGAKDVIKLRPADAMRPKAPKPVKKDIRKVLPFLTHMLTPRGFMATRSIMRNKVRSGFIVIGIIFSYSMIVIIGTMTGMIDSMFYNQFIHVLKYDAEIALRESVPYDQGVQSAMAMDEITYAEGVLKVPVVIYNGHEKTGTTLVGIKGENYLYKIYDDDYKINKRLDEEGMVLSNMIANNINVKKGDYIYISSPYFDKDQKIYISDVVNQSIGMSGYIDIELLSKLLNKDVETNSIIIKTSDLSQVRKHLIYSDKVSKIEDKNDTLAMYEELFSSYSFIIYMMQIAAAAIGFTIIYNTAVISMSERSREYATLRVLGLNINEVKEIMSFEYWILCFLGIVLGIPFTMLLNYGLQQAIDVDAFSWPSVIPSSAYVMGIVGCVFAVFLSNLSTVKAIKKLDLVEVLKERE